MKVLILGVNGFIGNALTHRILTTTDWEVYGLDMACDKLERSLGDPRFHFLEGDITINKEWIEYNIKKCDVVLPLVAMTRKLRGPRGSSTSWATQVRPPEPVGPTQPSVPMRSNSPVELIRSVTTTSTGGLSLDRANNVAELVAKLKGAPISSAIDSISSA